jgi:hypothetical protein
MGNEPQQKPPPKRPLALAFFFAMAGLLLLDVAVQLFVRRHALGQGCMLLVPSLAFLVLAVLWGSKRI